MTKEQRTDEIEVSKHKAATTKAADSFIDDAKDLLVAREQPDATPLLVIDQFEELLSTADDESAAPFLEFLGCVMSSPRSPWRCIATVRTDFLTTIQTRAELIAWKEQSDVYSLPLMKPDRFFDVIRRPAEKVEITFESDALVDQIVKDTGTNDALPLLAFTLRELYQQFGANKRFTSDEYSEKLGRLEGCLSTVADELFREPVKSDGVSNEASQRRLLLAFSSHLVRFNEQDEKHEFVRRTAVWSDFEPEVQMVLQRFIDRRLNTSRPRDETNLDSDRVIEVAHEALFRKWEKLTNWLDERRDLLRWRADIERDHPADSKEWPGLNSKQLAIARDWPKRRAEELFGYEIDWINDAIRKELRRRRRMTVVALAFAIIATIAAIFGAESMRPSGTLVRANLLDQRCYTSRLFDKPGTAPTDHDSSLVEERS